MCIQIIKTSNCWYVDINNVIIVEKKEKKKKKKRKKESSLKFTSKMI